MPLLHCIWFIGYAVARFVVERLLPTHLVAWFCADADDDDNRRSSMATVATEASEPLATVADAAATLEIANVSGGGGDDGDDDDDEKHEQRLTFIIELNAGERRDAEIVRVEKDSILRFVRGVGAVGRRVRICIEGYEVDVLLEETTRFAELDDAFELVCDRFGAFKYEFFVDDDQLGGYGYFSIVPEWRVGNAKTIALNSLTICTHLTKLLGPLSEWRERLRVAKEAGYNAIHLTPVQQLGISNSSYSIADFHSPNASLGDGATLDDVGELVEFLHREWHMLTIHDVVWNHAARNAPWLRVGERLESGGGCDDGGVLAEKR